MGERSNVHRSLVGTPEGKRPPRIPRRNWVNNIKIDLVDTGWGGLDWIGVAQDRDKWRALVKAIMNSWDLQNAGKLPSGYKTGGHSNSAE
jgi:hypothetical protein